MKIERKDDAQGDDVWQANGEHGKTLNNSVNSTVLMFRFMPPGVVNKHARTRLSRRCAEACGKERVDPDQVLESLLLYTEAEIDLARHHYEKFKGMPADSSTAEQVIDSPAGVTKWASFESDVLHRVGDEGDRFVVFDCDQSLWHHKKCRTGERSARQSTRVQQTRLCHPTLPRISR